MLAWFVIILCLFRKRLHHSCSRHRAGDVQGSHSYPGRAGETSERAWHHRDWICLSQNHRLLRPRLVRVFPVKLCLCQERLHWFLALFGCTVSLGFMMFYGDLLISGSRWWGLLSYRLSCLLAWRSDYKSGARLVSKIFLGFSRVPCATTWKAKM